MPADKPAPRVPAPTATRSRGVPFAVQILLVGLAVGVLARGIALNLAPGNSYFSDHVANMAWSDYAVEHGPLALYDLQRNYPMLAARAVAEKDNKAAGLVLVGSPHAYNYPPGSAYLFWIQGLVWRALDGRVLTHTLTGDAARQAVAAGVEPAIRRRLIETQASRFADAFPALVFDLLLAWGVARLIRAVRPSPIAEAIGAALTFVAPPIILDSSFWTQADAWIAAPLVWTLVLLLRQRLFWAGVVFGLGLMLKPQAILLLPVLAFVFLARRFAAGGSWPHAFALLKTLGGAALAVGIIAVPFMARDQDKHGDGTRWFQQSYVGTIGAERYDMTTLNAFNLWGLDAALSAPAQPNPRALLDTQATVLGLSRKTWGRIALLACVLGVGALCAWRGRWSKLAWVQCAFGVTFAAFLLPTGVHERYIYYCIPFAIALTCLRPLWTPVMLILLLVGSYEMLSFRYGAPIAVTANTLTLTLSALALLAMAISLGLMALRPPAAPAARPR